MEKARKSLIALLTLFLLVTVFLIGPSSSSEAATAGWKHDSTGWWYTYSDGSYPVNKWAKIGKYWYHFNSKGYMDTGWLKSGGKWYYLGTDGAMCTGWQKSGGKWYYLGTDGIMCTGWVKSGGKWYYLGTDGIMRTGWQKSGGKWYYLGTDGIMRTGWQTFGKQKYYLGTDGVMRTGWQTISSKKYYFGTDGLMRTGWQTVNSKKYYFGTNGVMRTGWQTISSKKYYFGTNGVMRTGKQTIDGKVYYFDTDGSLIDTSSFTLSETDVYLGSDEKFTLVMENAPADKIEWRSSSPKVAGVDGNGQVAFNTPGTCTITATCYGVTLCCTVKAVRFEFSAGGMQLAPGDEYELEMTRRGTEVPYAWSSSDETVATVSDTGLIYAVPGNGGTCDIRIGFETVNGMHYDSVEVHVAPFSTLMYAEVNEGNTYKIASGATTAAPEDGMAADLTLLSSGMETCYSDRIEHPADICTVTRGNYIFYFVSDTWENRVLIYRVSKTASLKNTKLIDNLYCVLGQKDATSSKAGYTMSGLNWPVGVCAAVQADQTIKIMVADAKNNRILVWNDIPAKGAHGTAADFSIMQMIDTEQYDYEASDRVFPNANESAIRWPWDLWTDGTRLIATSTSNGYVLLWEDGLPTAEDRYPDKVLKTGGTPRTITCKGNTLLIGDHNIRTASTEDAALRVFNDLSSVEFTPKTAAGTSETLFEYAEDGGDFIYSDPNTGQPSGTFLTKTLTTTDGTKLAAGTLLLHEGGAISVWKDGKIDSAEDRPDYYIGGNLITSTDYYYFFGGDIASIEQDPFGNVIFAGLNQGKLVGYLKGSFPGEPATIDPDELDPRPDGDAFVYNGAYYWDRRRDIGIVEKHCIEYPDLTIGADTPDEKVTDTLSKYQNCDICSDGTQLAAVDDYHSVLCLWKHIPDENDALPDVKMHFTSSVEDIAYVQHDGKTGLLVNERTRLYYWSDISNAYKGEYPDTYISGTIGSVTMYDVRSIDYCDGYFYMAQGTHLTIFRGVPEKTSEPVKTIDLRFTRTGGGSVDYYNPTLHVTTCEQTEAMDAGTYVGIADSSDSVAILNVTDVLSGTGTESVQLIEGAAVHAVVDYRDGERIYEDYYRSFNGASDVMVTPNGRILLCDGGFTRLIIWDSLSSALMETDGTSHRIATLGHGSSDYDLYDVMLADPTGPVFQTAYDPVAIQSADTFYNAHYTFYDGAYLWIGDYKFSGGIKRFSVKIP